MTGIEIDFSVCLKARLSNYDRAMGSSSLFS
jgi:hypothetical protein